MILESSGNLALKNIFEQTQWSTNINKTTNLSNSKLNIQNDGDLVLNDEKNNVLWSTNTIERTKKLANHTLFLGMNSNRSLSADLCVSSSFQNWVMVEYLDGYITLMNEASGLYLTDTGSSLTAKIDDGSVNQDWKINGSQLFNRATSQYLGFDLYEQFTCTYSAM